MKKNEKKPWYLNVRWQRIILTVAKLLCAILATIVLELAGQIAGWVALLVIALAFGRLCFIVGWVFCHGGWRWRL